MIFSLKRINLAQAKKSRKIKQLIIIFLLSVFAVSSTGVFDSWQDSYVVKVGHDENTGDKNEDKKKDSKEYLLLPELLYPGDGKQVSSLLLPIPILKSPFIRIMVAPPDPRARHRAFRKQYSCFASQA